ncbi:MAG: hypothetical protein HQK83_14270, partial [Fibrobacteria bacterium]|nr:hypothetical protein [Fibrobacteria bacterium]
IPIGPDETAGELALRLCELGVPLILEVLDKIEKGAHIPEMQCHCEATCAPKLYKKHGEITWDMPSQELHNRVRGFNPYPICFTKIKMPKPRILRIFKTAMTKIPSPGPGLFTYSEDEYPLVGCSDYMIKLLEVQLEGKAKTDGKAFLNGVQNKKDITFA